MSHTNMDVIRAVFEAWNRRDFGADLAYRRGRRVALHRRLAERLGLPGTRLVDLQHHLKLTPTGEYTAPLWSVRPQA